MIETMIKELRNEQELTQEHLAKVLSVHKNSISGWESGKNIPTLTKAIEIADFFGVSLDYLCERRVDNEQRN